MPSSSQKQHNYMEGIAHGGIKPGKGGPSVAVAKEFVAADKGKKKYSGKAARKRMYPSAKDDPAIDSGE